MDWANVTGEELLDALREVCPRQTAGPAPLFPPRPAPPTRGAGDARGRGR